MLKVIHMPFLLLAKLREEVMRCIVERATKKSDYRIFFFEFLYKILIKSFLKHFISLQYKSWFNNLNVKRLHQE